MPTHPYLDRPDYCFWRREVAERPYSEVEPFMPAKFRIGRADRVVSAGSCFAQHLARHLRAQNFNFYVTETAHPFVPADAGERYGYGLFSARYGNIYTARQLLQLLQRAYGEFKPVERNWYRDDGRVLDPFRPTIQPNGFVSDLELERDRIQHFAAVRRAIEDMDVFVFTLGLTETWLSAEDGAVFPVCPGVSGGQFDPQRYRFANFTVSEVVDDLKQCVSLIRRKNVEAKILLTVSPVPLVATMQDESVLVATTYSKSVLRVAADEIARNDDGISYFPSYEVITGAYARGRYFGPDLRSIPEEGVAHVMRLFMNQYALNEQNALNGQSALVPDGTQSRLSQATVDEIVKTMCDEEALDVAARSSV